MTNEQRRQEIRQLDAQIERYQTILEGLYIERAGRCIIEDDGSITEAWCCCCGKNQVFPNDGQDTCNECLQNI